MTTPVNTFTTTLTPVDLASMDLETALLTVQTQRANILESQLKDQMQAVQKRNQSIDTLNTILAGVRDLRPTGDTESTADLGSGGTVEVPTAHYIDGQQAYVETLTAQVSVQQSTLDAMAADNPARGAIECTLQVLQDNLTVAQGNLAAAQMPNASATTSISLQSALNMYGFNKSGTLKQSEFDQLINNITSRIDSLNSSQQLDMLRLQSLTNKRNEAFDVMTNFIKKMQDSRSSIVGNMR